MKLTSICISLFLVSAGLFAQTSIDLGHQVRGQLPVTDGGTGAADPANARTNLGVDGDFLAEDHLWSGEQSLRNMSGIRFAQTFASGGAGLSGDPWVFASGNPWAEAIADGGQVIILRPGHYKVTSCPAVIPANTTVMGLNRLNTVLSLECFGTKGSVAVIGASNATPIEIETSPAHGLSTGSWVEVQGVTGNTAANGQFQITAVDTTRFTLNGSSGNGAFIDAGTGMTAAPIFRISSLSLSANDQVELTTAANHNLVSGNRTFIEGAPGGALLGGQFFVEVTGPASVELNNSIFLSSFPSATGFIRGIEPVMGISTQQDAKGIQIQDLSFSSNDALLQHVVRFRASESKVSGLATAVFNPLSFDPAIISTGNLSAAVSFTGDGNPGDTATLTLLGGSSRASAAYTSYVVPGGTPLAVDAVISQLGGFVRVFFQSAPPLVSGDIVTVTSTAETVAAGAAGTFRLIELSPVEFALVGTSGNGNDCSSTCGGATATQILVDSFDVATGFAAHLNGLSEFSQDFYAAAVDETVHLLPRKYDFAPTTFTVASGVPHTTTPWSAVARGGNHFLFVDANSFSSVFERIFCGAMYANFHCIGLLGINNQHAFRDIRFSGGFKGGWAFRTPPAQPIQEIQISNVTAEATYGAIEIASMTASSVNGLYMEAPGQFGVRVNDLASALGGFTFVHADTISNAFLLGVDGLQLVKGRDLTVENSIAFGCSIGLLCENCTVRSVFGDGCLNESVSGYVFNSFGLGQSVQPVDRYGEMMATDRGALLSKSLTNFVAESENLTVSPWSSSNGSTSLVTATNPFGQTQLVSETTFATPAFGTNVIAAFQTVTGLQTSTAYGLSYWARVLTPGAECTFPGPRTLVEVSDTSGWIRVTNNVRSSSSGDFIVVPACGVATGALSDITFQIWGVMLFDLTNNGALPPYVRTGATSATVENGLYLFDGQLSGVMANLPRCRTFTVLESELTAAAATQDITLFELPARGVVTGVTLKHSTAFSGGALSGMTVSVGDVTAAAAYASSFDVFQAVSDSAFQDTPQFKSTSFAPRDILARFTATGDNVVNATAGSVDVTVCSAVRP